MFKSRAAPGLPLCVIDSAQVRSDFKASEIKVHTTIDIIEKLDPKFDYTILNTKFEKRKRTQMMDPIWDPPFGGSCGPRRGIPRASWVALGLRHGRCFGRSDTIKRPMPGCTLDGCKNLNFLKIRKSVMLGVWAAPGAPETPAKGGGEGVRSPPPFGRVSGAPGATK